MALPPISTIKTKTMNETSGSPGTRFPLTSQQIADLEKRFTYHAPSGSQPERYVAVRSNARHFAELIVQTCPAGREQALALTKLEEAVFWANAGIARNG